MQRELFLRGLAAGGIILLLLTAGKIWQFTVEAQALAAVSRATDFESYSEASSRLQALTGDKFSSPELFAAQANQTTLWKGESSVALNQLSQAENLRPRDFLLRQNIGLLSETVGAQAQSLAELAAAAGLAPYYAEPHWLYGNALWRAGNYAAADAELNRAVASDADYQARLLGLLWQTGGAEGFNARLRAFPALKPTAAVEFLLAKKRCAQGWQIAGLSSDGKTGAETVRLVRQFYAVGCYREAYLLGAGQMPRESPTARYLAPLQNGDFESDLRNDETTSPFGWELAEQLKQIRFERTGAADEPGKHQLQIIFEGSREVNTALMKQIIPVLNPTGNLKFSLKFEYLTRKLKAGSLPSLVIRGLNEKGERSELSRFKFVNLPSAERQSGEVGFTPGAAVALEVSIEREACTAALCPIFGELRLDNFSLAAAL